MFCQISIILMCFLSITQNAHTNTHITYKHPICLSYSKLNYYKFLNYLKLIDIFPLVLTVRWCPFFVQETHKPSRSSYSHASLCCHGYYRRLPSEEDGSMSSNGSGKLNTSKSSSARRTTTGSSSKNGKEELHKRSTNGEEDDGEEIWKGVRREKDGRSKWGRRQKWLSKEQNRQTDTLMDRSKTENLSLLMFAHHKICHQQLTSVHHKTLKHTYTLLPHAHTFLMQLTLPQYTHTHRHSLSHTMYFTEGQLIWAHEGDIRVNTLIHEMTQPHDDRVTHIT